MRSLRSLITEHAAKKAKTSDFYGEFCPICQKTKMSSYSPGPICDHCREKYGLTEKTLEPFVGRRIVIDQDAINWRTKPNPQITGIIDGQPWQSSFINNKWHTHSLEEPPNRNDATLVSNFLNEITPAWEEAARSKRTSIRRYRFVAVVGVTIVTAGYLLKKGKPRKEDEEE